MKGPVMHFWEMIKIQPEKWTEKEYGEEGDGFWVVAIYGNRVLWYNDIEEGFNSSTYSEYGHIDEYACNQYSLSEIIHSIALPAQP